MSRDWTQEEFGITEDTTVSDSEKEIKLLKEKLDIAVKALNEIKSMTFERYLMNDGWAAVSQLRDVARKALAKIKEIKL